MCVCYLNDFGLLWPVVLTVLRQTAEGSKSGAKSQYHIRFGNHLHSSFGALRESKKGRSKCIDACYFYHRQDGEMSTVTRVVVVLVVIVDVVPLILVAAFLGHSYFLKDQ